VIELLFPPGTPHCGIVHVPGTAATYWSVQGDFRLGVTSAPVADMDGVTNSHSSVILINGQRYRHLLDGGDGLA
jgi:hypothetical protein